MLVPAFEGSDAGVITFKSLHPRWSYVRLDEHQRVVETSEKRPISRNAIACIYYFKIGRDFVESAMSIVQKDSHVNGIFYISSTLNEMILKEKSVTSIEVETSKYHTFYTPQKIKEYESNLKR
jgi:ribosomal protein L31